MPCSGASVADKHPTIWVLAGINGAGKSSVGGEMLRRANAGWFNPDAEAALIRQLRPATDEGTANAVAWNRGIELLRDAIEHRLEHFFETTLGGNTITATLIEAARSGMAVRVWYCGLESVELHLARIARRVAEGGHDIPEDMVRARFDSSRMNLIRLLPHLTELRMLDNSAERKDPRRAKPRILLHILDGKLLEMADPHTMPGWAKPIVAAALA